MLLLFPAVPSISLCIFTVVKSHCMTADSAPGNGTTFKSRKQRLARVAKSFHLLWTALIRKRSNFLKSYPVQFLLHLIDQHWILWWLLTLREAGAVRILHTHTHTHHCVNCPGLKGPKLSQFTAPLAFLWLFSQCPRQKKCQYFSPFM